MSSGLLHYRSRSPDFRLNSPVRHVIGQDFNNGRQLLEERKFNFIYVHIPSVRRVTNPGQDIVDKLIGMNSSQALSIRLQHPIGIVNSITVLFQFIFQNDDSHQTWVSSALKGPTDVP